MACNPNVHDLVMRERAADAWRDAEQWRLLKATRQGNTDRGWVARL